MKPLYCLTLCLATVSRAAAADEPGLPVVFARSGQAATLRLTGSTVPSGQFVALWAFGHRWGDPAVLKGNAAEVLTPAVRVPVVFHVVPVQGPQRAVGEVVAYPDRPAGWDKRLRNWRPPKRRLV